MDYFLYLILNQIIINIISDRKYKNLKLKGGVRKMKKSAFLLMLFLISSVSGFDKMDFDISIDNVKGMPASFAKTSLSNTDYLLLSNSVTEMSMLVDGYFTIGTTNGITAGQLDDNCQITFGHPYAMTSYIYFSIDGVVYHPERFFYNKSTELLIIGDTLRLITIDPLLLEMKFDLIQQQNGETIEIRCTFQNLDNVAHQFGAGIVIDPALGQWGDGYVVLNGNNISNDTSYVSNLETPLYINERKMYPFGLNTKLETLNRLPDRVNIDNWYDIYFQDENSSVEIYDLAIEYIWNEMSIGPSDEFQCQLKFSLLQPDFPVGPFIRGNLPQIASIENNLLFPRSFTPLLNIYNNSNSAISGLSTLLSGSNYYDEWQTDDIFGIDAYESYFIEAELYIPEFYENTVLPLSLSLNRSGEILDEIFQNILIPASPFSDTGLVVTIDTIMIDNFPETNLIFKSEIQQSSQLLTQLRKENIFLYEDQNRIRDFTFGKDTTGGVDEADIVFVLDVTGSMGNEINDVKNNIVEFSDSLNYRGVDFRLGMVTFLDNIENVYDFTSDVTLFQGYIGAQYAHGGGDGPENSLDALMRAAQFDFRPAAKRIFIWITDYSYHINDAVTNLVVQEVVNELLAKSIVTHCIGSTGFQTEFYDPIVNVTGGKYFDIYGNFRDILLEISNLQGSSKYRIGYTSGAVTGSSHEIKLEIHYAGLGGYDIINFTPAAALRKYAIDPTLNCYPNPFNPITHIQIMNPARSEINIGIFNLLGQEVQHFEVSNGQPLVNLIWDARNKQGALVSNGIYFIRAEMMIDRDNPDVLPVEKIIYTK